MDIGSIITDLEKSIEGLKKQNSELLNTINKISSEKERLEKRVEILEKQEGELLDQSIDELFKCDILELKVIASESIRRC